jgi:hypothetical protein
MSESKSTTTIQKHILKVFLFVHDLNIIRIHLGLTVHEYLRRKEICQMNFKKQQKISCAVMAHMTPY